MIVYAAGVCVCVYIKVYICIICDIDKYLYIYVYIPIPMYIYIYLYMCTCVLLCACIWKEAPSSWLNEWLSRRRPKTILSSDAASPPEVAADRLGSLGRKLHGAEPSTSLRRRYEDEELLLDQFFHANYTT